MPLGIAEGVGSGGHHSDQDTALPPPRAQSRQGGQVAFTYSNAKLNVRKEKLRGQGSSSRHFLPFSKMQIFRWALIRTLKLETEPQEEGRA